MTLRTVRAAGTRTSFGAAAVFLATVLLAGCAGRYGATRWDTKAAQGLAAGEVLPAHRYYTWGSEAAPDVILALAQAHPLRTPVWREVAMTPGLLRRLAEDMRGARVEGPHARLVLDEHGRPIGAWYSYQQPTTVRLLDDGGVDMAPPIEVGDGPVIPWPEDR